MPRRKKDAATKVGKRRIEWVPVPLKPMWEQDLESKESTAKHQLVSAELFADGKLGGGH